MTCNVELCASYVLARKNYLLLTSATPSLQSLHLLIGRQIEVQRCDGDKTMFERPEICVFARLGRRLFAADPVIRPASRVSALHQFVAVDATAQPRNLHTREIGLCASRYIDVQQRVGRQALCQNLARDDGGELGRHIERIGYARRAASRASVDMANDGTPLMTPSIAAVTVPEYVMSCPRLGLG